MSSFPPHPEEIAALRATLEATEAELAEAASIRAELAELIEKLGVQRLVSSWNRVQRINDNLQQRVDDARRDLQTVRRVPDDVWIIIFQIWAAEVELGCAARDARDHAALRPLAQVPFIAASVCRYWRGIALDMPLFWRMIVLDVDEVDQRPAAWMKFFQCILLRSSLAPFDVYITIPVAAREKNSDLFNALYCFRDYWRKLDVVSEQYAHPVWTELIAYSSFPVLQVLSLVRINSDQFQDRATPTPVAFDAPQLRSLRLTDVVPVWDRCSAFPELKELLLEDYRRGIDLCDINDPQTALPQLEKLSIVGVWFFANAPHGLRFTRLHTLQYDASGAIEGFLFPRLRNLDIAGSFDDIDRVSAVLSQQELHTSLTVLTLSYQIVDAEAAVVLGLLRNLEELTLTKCNVFDTLLQTLSVPQDDSDKWIVPKLRRLQILHGPPPGLLDSNEPSWSCAVLQDVIDKRRQAAQTGGAGAPLALHDVLIEGFPEDMQVHL